MATKYDQPSPASSSLGKQRLLHTRLKRIQTHGSEPPIPVLITYQQKRFILATR
jgi:hypothetical protein